MTLIEEDARHLAAGGTLIVPAAAAVRNVRLAVASARLGAAAGVWRTPDVLTAEHWIRRECERLAETEPDAWPRVLGAAEEWLWWREAAIEVARDHPLLDPGALGGALQRADASAAAWGLAPVPGAADSEMRLLHRARARFQERCRDAGAASVTSLAARLHGRAATSTLRLRGFDAVPPRLAALTGVSADSAAREPPGAGTVRSVRAADATAECEAIAGWCRAMLERQPGARLRVIVPGPEGLHERLAALIRATLDPCGALEGGEAARATVAIEGSQPLGTAPLVAQALRSLEVLGGRRIPSGALARWIASPWWRAPGPSERATLAQRLRTARMASFDLPGLTAMLQQQAAEGGVTPAGTLAATLRAAAAALGAGRAAPQRWADRIEAALRTLGWPGELGDDPGLLRMRRHWGTLLEEFGSLGASLGPLARDEALDLLGALARHLREPTGEDDAAVTLSATLADPVAVCDGIWVGGLTADVLPQPVSPDPYLPLQGQLASGMPQASHAGRREQAQSLLRAWRSASRELVLCAPARDADRELLASPLLADLAPEDPPPASLWLPLHLRREACTEEISDDTGAPFDRARRLPGGTTALTLQNQCPFRAYAELRLGARAPEAAEPGVPADLRGRILHGALERLWGRLRDSAGLAACEGDALVALIRGCVRAAVERAAAASTTGTAGELTPALERECRRTEALIARLCELERGRGAFSVEETERALELQLAGGTLGLRVDRVDRVAAGRVILDYKSGAARSADWLGARPTHPQLLAYLAAIGADVVALATVHVTARETRLTGVAAEAGILPRVKPLPPVAGGWPRQCDAWRSLIERLVAAFLDGAAQVDPVRDACRYCHLHALCRIGEQGTVAAEAGEEEGDE